MNRLFVLTIALISSLLVSFTTLAHATAFYEYGEHEYVTIIKGMSPNGKYAITAHGEGEAGEAGDDNFHIYLTNAVTGKKIGPLEEIGQNRRSPGAYIGHLLDTNANAYCANWSADSQYVTVFYLTDMRNILNAMTYRIGKGRAFPIGQPVDATDAQAQNWRNLCQETAGFGRHLKPKERVFGAPRKQQEK